MIKTINGYDTKIKFVYEKHFLPQDITHAYCVEVFYVYSN